MIGTHLSSNSLRPPTPPTFDQAGAGPGHASDRSSEWKEPKEKRAKREKSQKRKEPTKIGTINHCVTDNELALEAGRLKYCRMNRSKETSYHQVKLRDLRDSMEDASIDDQYHQMSNMSSGIPHFDREFDRSNRSPSRMPAIPSSHMLPTTAQRLRDRHTKAQEWIVSRPSDDVRHEITLPLMAPSEQEVQPHSFSDKNETAIVLHSNPSTDTDEIISNNYGQCQMPSITVSGVLECFQHALSPDLRRLSNAPTFKQSTNNMADHDLVLHKTNLNSSSGSAMCTQNAASHQYTVISAQKDNGKRVGVIFTRHSTEKPNVAVISMIMHDSIFAEHNKDCGGRLEGSVVAAVNGVSVEDARHAARLVIMAEGEVSLTVAIPTMKPESIVGDAKEQERIERITTGDAKVAGQRKLKESTEEPQPAQSTMHHGVEIDYNDAASIHPVGALTFNSMECKSDTGDSISHSSSSIIDMAPSSLKQQLKHRMESRRKPSFNPLDQNYSSLLSSSCSASAASSASSVTSRRMNLFADRLDDNGSIRSDTSRISCLLDLKRADSVQSVSSHEVNGQETTPYAAIECIENDIMTPKKNNLNRKPTADDDCQRDEFDGSKNTWFKNTKHGDGGSRQLYMNSSSVTSATADLTYVPSVSNDDESTISKICENETKLNLHIDSSAPMDEDISISNVPTPMLLQRLENAFSNINNKQGLSTRALDSSNDPSNERQETIDPPALQPSSNNEDSPVTLESTDKNVRANDIFDRIMNKYSEMSFDRTASDVQSTAKTITSLSSESIERAKTNNHFSNLLRQQALDNSTSNNDSVKFCDHSLVRDDVAPEQPKTESLDLHRRVDLLQLQLKESIDEEADDNLIRVEENECEDDDLSTLSRSTCLTIGSASFCSTDTKEIQSHVKSLVHSIVQRELKKSGTMKKELEDALKSKARLESRVRKLIRRNNKQESQLKEAHLKNETIIEDIDKEMTFHLSRKAAELKSCIEAALDQAEESKRRAVELTKNSMEQEILTLRTELDEALANGVQLGEIVTNQFDLSFYCFSESLSFNQSFT